MSSARRTAPRPTHDHDNPYVGLDYFVEEEADLFFGREAERRMIIGNLRASRLTLLYAQSGVGKSSLLRAGVAARLSELARRSVSERGSPGYVPVVFNRWRDDPVPTLVAEIGTALRPFTANGPELKVASDGLCETIERAAVTLDATPLVILDQFEDYFLYHGTDAAGERFAGQLAGCLRRADLRANFLISIREDAYSQIGDRFKTLIPNVYGNYLHLDYLDERAARSAIRRPIEHVNDLRPAGATRFSIEDELVEQVLRQVRRERRGTDGPVGEDDIDHFETAYLQLVMERLWDEERAEGSTRLQLATLERLGGAEEIISKHLNEAMEDLPADQQEASAAAFRYLVTSGGTKIALTPNELSEFSGAPVAALEPALAHLEAKRVLRPVAAPAHEGQAGQHETRYELFHDVLGEAVLEWRATYEAEQERETLRRRLEEKEQRRLAEANEAHRAQRTHLIQWAAVGLTALVLLLAGAVVWALHERGQAQQERERARSEALAASAIGKLDVDPELSLLLAQAAWRTAPTAEADDALRRALSASPSRGRFPLGATEWAAMSDDATILVTAAGRDVALWRPGSATKLVTNVRRHAAWRTPVLAAGGGAVMIDRVPGVTVVRPEPGATTVTLKDAASLNTVALSDDGRWVAGVNTASVAGVWDSRSGRRVARLPGRQSSSLVFDFDPANPGRVLAGNCQGNRLLSWHWRTGKVVTVRRAREAPGTEMQALRFVRDPYAACIIALSPDGTRAVETRVSGSAQLWNLQSGRVVQPRLGGVEVVRDVDWSPSSRRVAVAAGKTATVFDGRSGAALVELAGHSDFVNSVDFDPRGDLIATTSRDGTARVWDARSGALEVELRGHTDEVLHAAFRPTRGRLLTVSADGTAREWQVASGTTLRGHTDWVMDAAFCPRGGRVATVGNDGQARVWSPDGSVGLPIRGTEASRTLSSVEFDATCSRIVTAGDTGLKGQVLVADARTRAVKQEMSTRVPVHQASFSPDGKWIVVSATGDTPLLWRLSDPAERRSSLGFPGEKWALSSEFSPDGRLLVTAGVDGVARIFDARSRRRMIRYRRGGVLYGATFSPDGRRVVSHGSDGTAQIWDARTGRELVILRGHASWVSSAAFSPDGRRVVTGSADQTTRVWDAQSGRLLSTQRMHGDSVNSVAFSPDGKTILSASDDYTARLYPCATCAPTEELVRLAKRRVFRPFTPEERSAFLQTD